MTPEYRHIAKTALAGEPLRIGASELKWYSLNADGAPIPAELTSAARDHITCAVDLAAGPGLNDQQGFVILHRCGADFYFLLISVWRGSNELWEAVHYRDASMTAFASFDPAYPLPGALRPTYCVWELGIVAHECAAWTAFLRSPGDDFARHTWRTSRFDGEV